MVRWRISGFFLAPLLVSTIGQAGEPVFSECDCP